MVRVGIVGTGAAWETRYRPALERLKSRIAVRAVYDPVACRAEQVAEELHTQPADGLCTLLDRPDVRAVLVLDAGWQEDVPLRFAFERKKPVYLAGSLGENLERLKHVHAWAQEAGVALMPEFSRRYTPASARLQELLATRLGRPQRIDVDAVLPETGDEDLVPGQGPGLDFLIG
ncbi:MAG: Gfo/Idh/MocA family oxidoreductase, partial [Planctomycetaceae bacterium]